MSGIHIKKNTAFFEGHAIEKLVKKYGTPLFLFSEKRIIDNYTSLAKSFEKYYKNVSIHYSVKTNFEPQILRTLRRIGAKGEIASSMEFWIAKHAGFKAEELVVDGPAWTDEEITTFITQGVGTLNVDSLDLMERVHQIAKKLKKPVRVGYRIHPEIKIGILKSFIEDYISKFGVRVSQGVDAYKKAQSLPYVQLVAISTHIGSMITDPIYYEKTIDKLVQLAAKLNNELGIIIEEINIGGGFGVQSLNYYAIQNIILEKAGVAYYKKAASIESFGKRITDRYQKKIKQYNLPEIKLILEPGRFLASDAGILVTRVVAVKKDWIFLDGGVNLIPESIFFIRRGFIVANKMKHPKNSIYNIAGPTLNTADILAVKQQFPKMAVGDTVIILDAGAYSLTRSNQFTALRPAALYVTKNSSITYLRKKENISDLLNILLI